MAETSEKNGPAPIDDGAADSPEDEPGERPRGDELDPELISLKRPRRTVGPILSLSVIAFCVFIMVRLGPDFRFSRESSSPRKIADLTALVDGQAAAPDDYVVVRAMPDYAAVLRVARGEADYGHRVAPVVGTDGRLWLMVVATPWTLEPDASHVYAGRLRRIADMPFYAKLRDFVASRPPAPRVVDAAAVRGALEAGADRVRDPFGDEIAITPATLLHIGQTVPDQARIEAFKSDPYPDETTWRTALIAAGVLPPDRAATRDDDEMVVYEVPAPDGLDAIKSKLIDAKLLRARAAVVIRHHEVVWRELTAGAIGLTLDGQVVPWPNISSLALVVPRTVHPNALILMTAERPGTYWYIVPVYVVLSLFILLFAWALVRYWQRERSGASTTS